eukprot:m.1137000 g.1137000  ORF g.1137000 m.1137000 type:complete len:520 (+) comp24434_c0_seq2:394-1953(+)
MPRVQKNTGIFQDEDRVYALAQHCMRIVVSIPLYNAASQIQRLKSCQRELDDIIKNHATPTSDNVIVPGTPCSNDTNVESTIDDEATCRDVAEIDIQTLRLLQSMILSRLACECSDDTTRSDSDNNNAPTKRNRDSTCQPSVSHRTISQPSFDHNSWLRGSDVNLAIAIRSSLQSKIDSVRSAASANSKLDYNRIMKDAVKHLNADVLQERKLSFDAFLNTLRRKGEHRINIIRTNNETAMLHQQSTAENAERRQRLRLKYYADVADFRAALESKRTRLRSVVREKIVQKSALIKRIAANYKTVQFLLITSFVLAVVWSMTQPAPRDIHNAIPEDCMLDQLGYASWVLPTNLYDKICQVSATFSRNFLWMQWVTYSMCLVLVVVMNAIFSWLGASQAGIAYTCVMCMWFLQEDLYSLAHRSGGILFCLALPYIWQLWKLRQVDNKARGVSQRIRSDLISRSQVEQLLNDAALVTTIDWSDVLLAGLALGATASFAMYMAFGKHGIALMLEWNAVLIPEV